MRSRTTIKILSLLALCGIPGLILAQTTGLPSISLSVDSTTAPAQLGTTIQIVLLMTVLALAPSILVMTTAFTRIVVIFHFLRQAIGTQNTPSNQILISLALFLTYFVMSPVFKEVNSNALQPYLDDQIEQEVALQNAVQPMKSFMLDHTREKELELFASYFSETRPTSPEALSMSIVIPAFMISELRVAFQIGFMLYLPMLLIDMVVAAVLMSMGMMMLPPVMISMPFKILLFVLVDGWYLVVESIINGLR
ncbi:MAG: flagellar type III secretion system pore protein FliP [Candidatus Marinimicrobia bacterium]|nr:flagellar type III secretion system pore protein FliP [Candidatus Neomarinimicrobiota bacterium]